MADDKQRQDTVFAGVVLETPPSADTPVTTFGLSLNDESMAQTASKLIILEVLLTLATKDLKFSDFIREILLIVIKVVKSEAGSILEVNHETHSLFFRAMLGSRSDKLSSFEIPVGQGIAGHVAESHLPVIVENVEENRMHLTAIQNAIGFEARNLIAVPILIKGKTFGVMELLNRVGEINYTPADVELLNYICEMIGKTIEIRLLISASLKSKKDAA